MIKNIDQLSEGNFTVLVAFQHADNEGQGARTSDALRVMEGWGITISIPSTASIRKRLVAANLLNEIDGLKRYYRVTRLGYEAISLTASHYAKLANMPSDPSLTDIDHRIKEASL